MYFISYTQKGSERFCGEIFLKMYMKTILELGNFQIFALLIHTIQESSKQCMQRMSRNYCNNHLTGKYCFIIILYSATENIETANIKEFEFEYISSLESYDIKFTNIEKMDRFDVRITFDAANQPKILIAKKNEVKLLMFDFLYLHR